MGGMYEREIELRLLQAGQQLENPARSIEWLLMVLRNVEMYLSMVNRSPSQSMLDAMRPLMDALVNPQFMINGNETLKLQVLSCLSHIIRITAPNQPYDRDQIKDIFNLIVTNFKDLGKMNSSSFPTRFSVLKTVADVGLCQIMCELELNELIADMFKHFFSAVSQNTYSEDVYYSMQRIMSLTLDKSENISDDLVSVVRNNLTLEIMKSSPAAHTLARNVVASCAEQLQPYFWDDEEEK